MPADALPPAIVRAYDIRGSTPDQIDEAVARRIGAMFGTWLARRGGRSVGVGRDARASSPALYESVVLGLQSVGMEVHAAGMAPTPVIGWMVDRLSLDGGLIVTASHNPPEYNGFKLLASEAQPLWPREVAEVAQIQPAVPTSAFAPRGTRREVDAIAPYLELLAERFGHRATMRIAVDAGHGVASLTGPQALRSIGASLEPIRCTAQPVDGLAADPQNPDTMRALARVTVDRAAELGIAWDGDGDRIGVLDHLGRRYEADWLVALLARPLLARRRGAEILIDFKTSSSAIDDIRRHGGHPTSAMTGYSYFRRQMRERQMSFGGETSGHIMFGPDYRAGEHAPWIDDGVYAACALLSYLADSEQRLADAMSSIEPRPISPELRLPCPDSEKERIAAAIGDWYAGAERQAQIDRRDGARVELADAWLHARASNTAPALSLRLEADDEAAYSRVAQQLHEILTAWPQVIGTDQLSAAPTIGPQPLI